MKPLKALWSWWTKGKPDACTHEWRLTGTGWLLCIKCGEVA